MTCGKRLPLFIKTMDSFLENCEDKDLISRWIVNDDGSTDHEIEEMKRRYPFLEIHKSEGGGQAGSLNWLFSQVRTEWFFHLEDDWLFLHKGKYLSDCFEVARSDPRIRNVVLRGWRGAYIRNGSSQYRMHIWHERRLDTYNNRQWFADALAYIDFPMNIPGVMGEAGRDNLHRYMFDVAMCYNDWLWFGYSLNPGIQHLPTVKELGVYGNLKHRDFDKEIAKKYHESGYKRANLLKNYIRHIGEKTDLQSWNWDDFKMVLHPPPRGWEPSDLDEYACGSMYNVDGSVRT